MRFLMLNWRDPANPLSGGAERVTQGYLDALAARGHEVFWFANAFPDGADSERIGPITIARGGGKGSSIARARAWSRSQAPFDLVIDQHHGIPWLAPWWSGARTVAFIHEVLGPIWNSFYPWPLSLLGRWQERWTHWLYRDIPFWTACESTRDQLLRHGVRHVKLLRYGVHTQPLPALPPKELAAPLRLAVVSRLAPNKRIRHAIETVAELRRRGLEARLQIVGRGEEGDSLKAAAASLGLADAVAFMGGMEEAAKDLLLRDSHFLLHTSQREGWGLNVIEANAMGTPAAVYPVPGLVESTLDGKTGLVAPAETPAALAGRIAETVGQPDVYAALRTRAWRRAATFHWSQVLPPACDWLERCARGEFEYSPPPDLLTP